VATISKYKNLAECLDPLGRLAPQRNNNVYSMSFYNTYRENGMSLRWNEIAQQMYNRSEGAFIRKPK
jgi:hypothetical protein